MLTQGLSSSTDKAVASDWRPLVVNRLLAQFEQIETSSATRSAEQGLALEPSAYWFLWRVDALYGRVLIAWDLAVSIAHIVLPFDSGGLWHRRIRLTRDLDDSERRAFVASHDMSVAEAVTRFLEWYRDSFDEPFEYVDGIRVPGSVLPEFIDPTSNAALAWSWEARLPKSGGAAMAFTLRTAFLESNDLRNLRAHARQAMAPDELRAFLTVLARVHRVDPTLALATQSARASVAHDLATKAVG